MEHGSQSSVAMEHGSHTSVAAEYYDLDYFRWYLVDLSELNQFGDVLGFYGVRLISVCTSLYGCSVGLKTPGNDVNSLAIYKIQQYTVKFSGFEPSEPWLLCTRMSFLCCYARECSIPLVLWA